MGELGGQKGGVQLSGGGVKKLGAKKQEEPGGGVLGGKNLPVTKHDRMSLNRPVGLVCTCFVIIIAHKHSIIGHDKNIG